MERRKTRLVKVGDRKIGSFSPISVQSMTNTDTKDVEKTVKQILELEEAGCDLIRFAVNDQEDAEAIPMIKSRIHIPTIADIQFDYRLALAAVANGCDGLRINPGNIGEKWKVKEVVNACEEKGISIRIGVNSGSLDQKFIDQFGGVTPPALAESALSEVEYLESLGFFHIKASMKSSDVMKNIEAYRYFSQRCDVPVHLGVTEAGRGDRGIIKSAIGIGTLLAEGIGDTIRVSLTDNPVEEVYAGKNILKSLGLLRDGIDLVSCPTCGRTKIDLISLVKEAEDRLKGRKESLKIALMGCVVNGPGEAKEADYGITGGDGQGIIFKKGIIIRKVPEEQLLDALLEEIEAGKEE